MNITVGRDLHARDITGGDKISVTFAEACKELDDSELPEADRAEAAQLLARLEDYLQEDEVEESKIETVLDGLACLAPKVLEMLIASGPIIIRQLVGG